MSNSTLIAVSGITVSGVIGPMVTAWATRRANKQQFERGLAADRRADLRALVDEASGLLGTGATQLRIARDAESARVDAPEEVHEWGINVHLLKQRLLLRLSAEHEVMRAYEGLISALENLGRADAPTRALPAYEAAHKNFLDAARRTLASPIEDA